MSSRTAPPPALAPYLQLPPEASLILLTSTLGTSTTWLTSRFVSTIVSPPADTGDAVVLVSWLRDEKFWGGEMRRGSGQDIAKLSSTGHFAFVDGLSTLANLPKASSQQADAALQSIGKAIATAISNLATQTKNITLILDGPDILLATSTTTPSALATLILRLRSKVHSTILTLSADLPLLSAATPSLLSREGLPHGQPTPLELSTAAFLVQQAHAARFVMSVRELETGAARDVSGVLRVTRGGDGDLGGDEEDGDVKGEEEVGEVREMEALFLVGRDGGVKVFERGSAG